MENKLTKKYGLVVAICMVVGIVIGSGIFFKAGKVLSNVGGNIGSGLLVVGLVGGVMIICSLVFATLAGRYEKVNGVVDYAEATCGARYAYYVGWFMTTMYYPILTATLAWVSAQYACVLFGYEAPGAVQLAIAALFLVGNYAVNALSPKLAGYFQVSTTVIKLIPLLLVAVVGTIAGLVNGMTPAAFSADLSGMTVGTTTVQNNVFVGVSAFAFAYEGWIIATAINSELKNAKRNLPLALVFGSIAVIAIYILYFLGMTGTLSTEQIIGAGESLPGKVFAALFNSEVVGSIVMVFVVISCLGTTNGLMLGCCRGMYSLAARGEGPKPKLFAQIDSATNIPANSSVIGLLFCGLWLFQWQVFFFDNTVLGAGRLPAFWCWEGDEVSIITLYAFYVPMFIAMMIRCKDLHPVRRFVLPCAAVLCCFFMCYCAFSAYRKDGQIFSYLLTFAVIMLIGFFFSNDFKKLLAARRGNARPAAGAESKPDTAEL